MTSTTVTVHVGQYLKHGLQQPLVSRGLAEPQFVGETFFWERPARALQHLNLIARTRETMYSQFLYASTTHWMHR